MLKKQQQQQQKKYFKSDLNDIKKQIWNKRTKNCTV